jgi:predicted O-methyltransferase YrrM
MLSDSPVLKEMEARAKEQDFPIIGPVVGRLLYQYAKAIGAKRIFELGSGFGYSAMWFAKALPADGEIYGTDHSEENLFRLRRYFESENVPAKLHTLQGDAVANLEKTGGLFDIILMDIDKKSYLSGFKLAWPKVRTGGIFIADNALWHGRVVEDKPDETTQAVLDFTGLAFNQKDAITTLIPLRDGVIVCFKI